MVRACGLLGLVLWAAGTVTAIAVTYGDVRTESVELHLPDGTPLHGTLYRPRSADGPAPAAVVLHGTAVSQASCAPGLAVPLARIGFVVLAVDLRGHGRSGGTVPRRDYDQLEAMLAAAPDQPELDAALAFLRRQPFVDHRQRVALLGHSRGGWMAATTASRRSDVSCVVTVSCAPAFCDARRPRNLLFLVGGLDGVIPLRDYLTAFAHATAGHGEPGEYFGDYGRGTGRLLVVSPWSLHLSTLADPTISRRAVQWAAWSVGRPPGTVPGERLMVAGGAVVLASLGALLALGWGVAGMARLILPAPAPMSAGRPRAAMATLLLAPLLAAPAAAWVGDGLPDGGVLFAGYAFAQLLTVALVAAAASRLAPGRASPAARVRGVALGLAAGALGLLLLGLTWGTTWLDLVPTARRILLGLVLLVLFLPLSGLLVHGVQRALGQTPGTFGGACLRGLAWLGPVLFLWLGHAWLVRPGHPFLGIPLLFVGASSIIPLPLWLLADRPGLGMARAVSHALAAACFLACHLPFVHG